MKNNFRLALTILFSIMAPGLFTIFSFGDEKKPSGGEKKNPIFVRAKGKKVDFEKDVKPVLETHCLQCHNEKSDFAGLKFHTRKMIIDATKIDRPILIPGNARNSSLYLVTALPKYFVEAMPAQGHQLSEEQKDKIYRWIQQGAKWPVDLRLEASPGTTIIKSGSL